MKKYQLDLRFDGHKESLEFDSLSGLLCYLAQTYDLIEEELDYLLEFKQVSLGLDTITFSKL